MAERCATCRHWREVWPGSRGPKDARYDDRVPELFPTDPLTYEPLPLTFRVGACVAPRMRHVEALCAADEAVAWDGSDYMASLWTGEAFGCVLHEPAQIIADASPT